MPELFLRYHNYQEKNSKTTNLCSASEWLLQHHSNKFIGQSVSSDAYLASLIAATSAIPLVILMGVVVKMFDKKILLCMYEIFNTSIF